MPRRWERLAGIVALMLLLAGCESFKGPSLFGGTDYPRSRTDSYRSSKVGIPP